MGRMQAPVRLGKYHGLGNDFLVVLDEENGRALEIGPAEARAWCDRHTGIGADGLLHGSAPAPGAGVDIVMRLYNADGSVAEMSGNGVRCFGHAVARARGMAAGPLRVGTDAGVRELVLSPGADPAELAVAVGMGVAGPGPVIPAEVAARLPERHATVDMGNPHLVLEVPEPAEIDLAAEGGRLERSFPDGINVEFIAVRAPDQIELTVWERGAGITQACGTGACAAAATARAWGATAAEVVVQMPGGSARVAVAADGAITLTGPSVHIATVEVAGRGAG